MTGLNRPARLNRIGLAVVGVVLVAAGGFVVATHLGMLTIVDPHSVLVPGSEAPPTWVLYVIAAIAIIAGTLMVRWLLAQLVRTPTTHTWRLEQDSDRGRTELAASTATAPLVGELTTYTGVHGRPRHPHRYPRSTRPGIGDPPRAGRRPHRHPRTYRNARTPTAAPGTRPGHLARDRRVPRHHKDRRTCPLNALATTARLRWARHAGENLWWLG